MAEPETLVTQSTDPLKEKEDERKRLSLLPGQPGQGKDGGAEGIPVIDGISGLEKQEEPADDGLKDAGEGGFKQKVIRQPEEPQGMTNRLDDTQRERERANAEYEAKKEAPPQDGTEPTEDDAKAQPEENYAEPTEADVQPDDDRSGEQKEVFKGPTYAEYMASVTEDDKKYFRQTMADIGVAVVGAASNMLEAADKQYGAMIDLGNAAMTGKPMTIASQALASTMIGLGSAKRFVDDLGTETLGIKPGMDPEKMRDKLAIKGKAYYRDKDRAQQAQKFITKTFNDAMSQYASGKDITQLDDKDLMNIQDAIEKTMGDEWRRVAAIPEKERTLEQRTFANAFQAVEKGLRKQAYGVRREQADAAKAARQDVRQAKAKARKAEAAWASPGVMTQRYKFDMLKNPQDQRRLRKMLTDAEADGSIDKIPYGREMLREISLDLDWNSSIRSMQSDMRNTSMGRVAKWPVKLIREKMLSQGKNRSPLFTMKELTYLFNAAKTGDYDTVRAMLDSDGKVKTAWGLARLAIARDTDPDLRRRFPDSGRGFTQIGYGLYNALAGKAYSEDDLDRSGHDLYAARGTPAPAPAPAAQLSETPNPGANPTGPSNDSIDTQRSTPAPVQRKVAPKTPAGELADPLAEDYVPNSNPTYLRGYASRAWELAEQLKGMDEGTPEYAETKRQLAIARLNHAIAAGKGHNVDVDGLKAYRDMLENKEDVDFDVPGYVARHAHSKYAEDVLREFKDYEAKKQKAIEDEEAERRRQAEQKERLDPKNIMMDKDKVMKDNDLSPKILEMPPEEFKNHVNGLYEDSKDKGDLNDVAVLADRLRNYRENLDNLLGRAQNSGDTDLFDSIQREMTKVSEMEKMARSVIPVKRPVKSADEIEKENTLSAKLKSAEAELDDFLTENGLIDRNDRDFEANIKEFIKDNPESADDVRYLINNVNHFRNKLRMGPLVQWAEPKEASEKPMKEPVEENIVENEAEKPVKTPKNVKTRAELTDKQNDLVDEYNKFQFKQSNPNRKETEFINAMLKKGYTRTDAKKVYAMSESAKLGIPIAVGAPEGKRRDDEKKVREEGNEQIVDGRYKVFAEKGWDDKPVELDGQKLTLKDVYDNVSEDIKDPEARKDAFINALKGKVIKTRNDLATYSEYADYRESLNRPVEASETPVEPVEGPVKAAKPVKASTASKDTSKKDKRVYFEDLTPEQQKDPRFQYYPRRGEKKGTHRRMDGGDDVIHPEGWEDRITEPESYDLTDDDYSKLKALTADWVSPEEFDRKYAEALKYTPAGDPRKKRTDIVGLLSRYKSLAEGLNKDYVAKTQQHYLSNTPKKEWALRMKEEIDEGKRKGSVEDSVKAVKEFMSHYAELSAYRAVIDKLGGLEKLERSLRK